MGRTPAGVALVAAIALSSCTHGGEDPPTASSTATATPTSVSPSPTRDPLADAKRAVLGAYNGMYVDLVAATNARNPASPLLGRHATGAARAALASTVQVYVKENVILRARPPIPESRR